MLFTIQPSRLRATHPASRLVRGAGADREGDFPMTTKTADLTRDNRIKAAFAEISAVLVKHGVSLFFSDKPGQIWIDGELYGSVDHTEDGCGQGFEVVPSGNDDDSRVDVRTSSSLLA